MATSTNPTWETTQEGDELPELRKTPALIDLVRYSAGSGDFNPLHSSPQWARKAGFDRPILHGLCTYGIACKALLQTCCNDEPVALESMSARFKAPVIPGDALRTSIWLEPSEIRFECLSVERNEIVLADGSATVK